jgi:hypothetical protein
MAATQEREHNLELAVDVDRIDGKPRTIRELFVGRRYSVDYYQREYAWSEANVHELVEDLSGRFLSSWEPAHERLAVASYRPYFLGPIVTNNRSGTLYLVDGQQRVTTLTLLLILLHHLQRGRPDDDRVDVRDLIASTKYGRHSFVLDIDTRTSCMRALLDGRVPDQPAEDDSVANLWSRYQDLAQLFPEELKGDALPFFIDWLLDRVMVVEIATSDQEMAIEIFESMNDRGLRLTTTDMLKSYLLASMQDPAVIAPANQLWRSRVSELCVAEGKTETDFIKHWLRAKYAQTIRERRKDAVPLDFDVIGTAPHKWVRDRHDEMGLRKPDDFADFVSRDFKRLSARFLQLLDASRTLTPGFEEVFYNAWNGFTLQYPLILAAVTPVDDDETFLAKTRMVAGYIDLLVARRMVSFRNFGYNTVQYTMFNLMKDIRELDPGELADTLGARVADLDGDFSAVGSYRLHQRNGSHVKYLLARLTAWIESECGGTTTFADLTDRNRKDPFEIEHILANHPELHPEYSSEQEFADQRNQFGALLLLPRSFNASYGDKPYAEKLPHYYAHNLLARSLHPRCYENNPRFTRLAAERHLPFEPHPAEFDAAAIEQRQSLYEALCTAIWDPASLGLSVPDLSPAGTAESSPQRRYGVSFWQLVEAGLIAPGSSLTGTRAGHQVDASVTAEGRIRLDGGSEFDAPSAAAIAALHVRSWNGWDFWRVNLPNGPVRLSRIRQDYLQRGGVPGEDSADLLGSPA